VSFGFVCQYRAYVSQQIGWKDYSRGSLIFFSEAFPHNYEIEWLFIVL